MGVQKFHAQVAERQGLRTRVGGMVSGLSLHVFFFFRHPDMAIRPFLYSVVYLIDYIQVPFFCLIDLFFFSFYLYNNIKKTTTITTTKTTTNTTTSTTTTITTVTLTHTLHSHRAPIPIAKLLSFVKAGDGGGNTQTHKVTT